MSLRENEERLIRLLEQQRDQDCLDLLERARDEAKGLLRTAYRQARDHVHAAAAAERSRVRTRVGSAKAELETRRRQHLQRLGFVVLETALARLPELLAQQWRDPDRRAAWIGQIVEQALERLPKGQWAIRYPENLTPSERGDLAERMAVLPVPPTWREDDTLECGLIIESDGVRLDASTSGLMADQGAVEARLLALIELEDTQ
jgi:hypothetical protein